MTDQDRDKIDPATYARLSDPARIEFEQWIVVRLFDGWPLVDYIASFEDDED